MANAGESGPAGCMRPGTVLRRSATWVLAASMALACRQAASTDAELDDYRRLRGELARVETSEPEQRGRYVTERLRLESTTGLVVMGRVSRPSAAGCFPAVLLRDGREENSGVIGRLPSDFGNVVVVSLDYPAELPYTVRLSDFLLRSAALRDAARRIPATFSLAASYLARRSDVDTARIAVAATSFAVPFATIASAADERFRDVALIYGAGDLPRVMAANLSSVPRLLRPAGAHLAMRPFAAFAPERFIARIAPRPVVMINGIDDPQMPELAVRHLYEAAREPKTLIWLRTGHLMPTDSVLIRALIDTAFSRLPVLRDSTPASSCTGKSTR
jgi:hypothetical protein